MTLRTQHEKPVYVRLRETIADAILAGKYGDGDPLPSVRALAAEEQANPLTVAKAYQGFQDEGLIVVKRGVGMFVAPGARARLGDSERSRFLKEEWPRDPRAHAPARHRSRRTARARARLVFRRAPECSSRVAMETRVLPFNDEAIAEAARLILAGEPVAVPTETVYGLAADATNAEAVARIYEAKGRPSFNPLIVHVPDLAAAERIGDFDDAARDACRAALARSADAGRSAARAMRASRRS